MEKVFYVVSNYNNPLDWLKEYTDDYLIYDRSDTDEFIKGLKAIKVPNIGWDIYDKLTYLIDHYDELPDIILLIKGNLFKHISKEEFDQVKDTKTFTPLLTKNHRTYEPVCRYKDGIYEEINNRWYLPKFRTDKLKDYDAFWDWIEPGYQQEAYKRFAPGSNYIVTRQDVLKHPKAFYEKLRSFIDYCQLPGECQILERDLYHIWHEFPS